MWWGTCRSPPRRRACRVRRRCRIPAWCRRKTPTRSPWGARMRVGLWLEAMPAMQAVYVYMFEVQDPETGEWTRSRRLATAAAIARMGARQVRDSGRLVFPELVGSDGLVSPAYAS